MRKTEPVDMLHFCAPPGGVITIGIKHIISIGTNVIRMENKQQTPTGDSN